MGRLQKRGLDYFPFDTVLDTKMELIEAEFGLTGFALVVKLFQKIYGERGYYCEWTDEVALLFAKRNNVGGNVVSELIDASVRRGIFDKDLFDKYGVLTSQGIQKRYFEAVSRRTQIDVVNEYLLISLTQNTENVNINSINVYKNSKNVYKNTQSKVKESKVKENKVDDVMKAYEENIEKASSATKTKLTLWKNSVSEELIILAIEEAVSQNKKSYAYINAILESWKEQGFKNIDDVKKYQENYKRKNKKGLNNYSENRSLSDFEKQMLERRINGN